MSKELLEELISAKDGLRELIAEIEWECCPKTARKYKRAVKALTETIKKIKAEESQ